MGEDNNNKNNKNKNNNDGDRDGNCRRTKEASFLPSFLLTFFLIFIISVLYAAFGSEIITSLPL